MADRDATRLIGDAAPAASEVQQGPLTADAVPLADELPALGALHPPLSRRAAADLIPMGMQQPFLDPPPGLVEQPLLPLQQLPLSQPLQQRQHAPSPLPLQQPSPQPQQQQRRPAVPQLPASGRPEASRSLYVGKLHPHVNEAMLLEIFSTLGAVQEVKVIRDKLTSLSAGYGFITYYDSR